MEVDSTAQIQELEADCEELKNMLARATRPNVRAELTRVNDVLQASLARARATAGIPPATAAPTEPAPAPSASSSAPSPEVPKEETKPAPQAKAAPAAEVHQPVPVPVKSTGPWTEITTFALDLGGYDKPIVTVDVRLKGVEQLERENVTCDFTEASFDLKIVGLDGQNYRFLKTNLDKDIIPAESNVSIKKNHVILTLKKVKGQYGYDSWTDLVAKGRRKPTSKTNASNPQDSIMDMMKDLYEDGDDNMKKIIGEAMYKAHRGEKYEPKDDPMKMPGLSEDSSMPGLSDI